MALTKDQEKELVSNGIHSGSVGRFYYDEMRSRGVSHKDAIKSFIDGLNNMHSESFDEEQLKVFKSIIGQLKGEMF